RIEFLGSAQLTGRFFHPAKRQKKKHHKVLAPENLARIKLDRAPKAPFREVPLSLAGLHHCQSLLRIGRPRIQLDRLLRGSPSPGQLSSARGRIELIDPGGGGGSRRNTGISWRKRWILRDRPLKEFDAHLYASHVWLHLKSARAKVEIVGRGVASKIRP